MSAAWRGYIGVSRFVDNLGEDHWIAVIHELRQVEVSGPATHLRLQERGQLDIFNHGTEEEPDYYANTYTFEASFMANMIDFEKFKNRLVNLFCVDPELVTYTTGTTTIRERLSCFATFKYNGVNRLRVGLFGCASDSELCTWPESRLECEGYIQDEKEAWEEEIEIPA